MKPHRGVPILVFGILGLVVCPFLGVGAWVMGTKDLEDMANGRMDPSGKDLTTAGRICGIVGTGLLALQLLIMMVAVIGMGIFAR